MIQLRRNQLFSSKSPCYIIENILAFFQNKTPAFKKVAYVITWILPALSLVQILTKSKKGRWIWLFFSNHACAINWHLTNSNRDGCFLALIDNTYKIVVTFLARKVKNERNELYICHKSSFYCHQESLFALALAAMLQSVPKKNTLASSDRQA